MPDQIQININPLAYFAELQKKLAGHGADLRCLLSLLNEKTYAQKSLPLDTSRPTIRHDPSIDIETTAIERQTSKCFSSCIDDFGVFLAQIIALQNIPETRGFLIEHSITEEEAIQDYLVKYLDQEIQVVLHDKSLTNPAKLARFSLPDNLRVMSENYFRLRNCFSHHDRVAKEEIRLEYFVLTFLVDGQSMPLIPSVLKDGQTLQVRVDLFTRVILSGEKVVLTEEDCQGMILTLQTQICPSILNAIAKRTGTPS